MLKSDFQMNLKRVIGLLVLAVEAGFTLKERLLKKVKALGHVNFRTRTDFSLFTRVVEISLVYKSILYGPYSRLQIILTIQFMRFIIYIYVERGS